MTKIMDMASGARFLYGQCRLIKDTTRYDTIPSFHSLRIDIKSVSKLL